MSHRKYEHSVLGFFQRKRANKQRQKEKAFPKDDPTKPCSLTSYFRLKIHKKETGEVVSTISTPQMLFVGVVGYVKTPRGLRKLCTVWDQNLSEEVKCLRESKEKAYVNYYSETQQATQQDIQSLLEKMKKYSTVIRVLVHTDQNKTHFNELQVNGGVISNKVNYAYSYLGVQVPADEYNGITTPPTSRVPMELKTVRILDSFRGCSCCCRRRGRNFKTSQEKPWRFFVTIKA